MRTVPKRRGPGAVVLVVPLLLAAACDGGGSKSGAAAAHTVTATAGAGGSIGPATAVVSDGATAAFTVTAERGYRIDGVSGCGGALSGDTYTTGPIAGDCTVSASFVPAHAVVAHAWIGGSIAPAAAMVDDGASATFTVTPAPGYRIDGVSGCGGTLSGAIYTTAAVTSDCTVTAGFVLTHAVSANAWIGGSIAPAGATVDDGAIVTFTLTPDPGYRIAAVSGCGGTLSGATYTTAPVTSDCTVTAGFVLTHTVSTVAGAGGSIGPASAAVDDGATAAFSVTADPGMLASATGCGGSLSGSTYTTGPITRDCAVTASFGAVSAPTLIPRSVKTFHFAWPAVAGASEYRLLEDPDGVSSFAEVASITGATTCDLVVSLAKRVAARYRVRACNDGGCADSAPVSVSGTLAAAVGYVKASNTGAWDDFGYSVALSADGDTLAVGAWLEDGSATGIDGASNDAAGDAGAVYVFTRSGGSWSQQAYVKASNAGGGDQFGYAVALSANGSTLAVGARLEDGGATGIDGSSNDAVGASGAVYVFTRTGASWGQQAYVKPSNTGGADNFGSSVALSADGDTLAVGAPLEDGGATGIDGPPSDALFDSGAVYLFGRTGASWSQQAYVKASNTGAWDNFGHSVALSDDGDTLAVGAWLEDGSATGIDGPSNDAAGDAGAVYVFTRSGGSWSQQAYVKASNTGGADQFGAAVALAGDGDTLAVGAPLEDGGATGIGGDATSNAAGDSGAVYVFIRTGASWGQQAYVKASNTGGGDQFGYSVALSAGGSTLAVGAWREDGGATGIGGDPTSNAAGDSGAVYAFARSGATWRQRAYVKASNTGGGDQFGCSVALSGDGDTLAVGAWLEDGGATGVDGLVNDAIGDGGAVYLY